MSIISKLLPLLLMTFYLAACGSASSVSESSTAKTDKVIDESQKVNKASTPSSEKKEEDNIREIKLVADEFITSLSNIEADQFKELVSSKGLVIIRHILWGTDGARGQNIRQLYTKNQIPSNMMFPVLNEMSFDPISLFDSTIVKGIDEIPIVELDEFKVGQFNFTDGDSSTKKDPIINSIIELCEKIIKTSNTSDPQIFVLGDQEIALTQSDYSDVLFGSWAIFKKENEIYKLRALINFP
ncbi:MAG: hypothetical protein WD469_03765 [Paenibacillaceae bacterium]